MPSKHNSEECGSNFRISNIKIKKYQDWISLRAKIEREKKDVYDENQAILRHWKFYGEEMPSEHNQEESGSFQNIHYKIKK